MNNYNDFEVKDWLDDIRFQNWVYRGESDMFWQNFINNTPSQHENIEQAKNILLSVRGELDIISDREVKSRVSEMLDSISDEDKSAKNPWWKGKWLQVAAILFLTAGLGQIYWNRFFPKPAPYYAMLKSLGNAKMKEIVNNSEQIKLVNLPDGSSVVLKKNARLSFPIEFAADKREVYLLGEAFFEVEKNPDQPFYVHAGEMLTKVTGTSFSIQANERAENVNLVVKSGIVEVTAVSGNPENLKAGKATLSPNQLVSFNSKTLEMKTKTVKNPVLLNLPIESQDFSFKRMPLKDVFKILEAAYGINIGFDQNVTKDCTITARLGDEPVSEKLDMICAVVNATYESREGLITVVSDGCKE